jgi:hypothetical protein
LTLQQLLRLRLRNQQLIDPGFRTPQDLVSCLGAVQAQDYGAAKWAIALRTPGVRDTDVDAALDSGAIVRTHVLRPTWHFVAPADVRWMLALSAPRIRTAMGSYFRKQGLDAATLAKSRKTIARALTAGRALTRAELTGALTRARIPADGLRGVFMLIDAEIEALIVSGPRRGKQFTYARLDDRVPAAKPLTRDESIARLTERYFSSHGPATLRDFAWWSGLTIRDARAGLAMCGSLQSEVVGACTYWFAPATIPAAPRRPMVHLLPNFDEYLVAYQDREVITNGFASRIAISRGDLLSHRVIVDGMVIGTCKRVRGPDVTVQIATTDPVDASIARALMAAALAYGNFLDRPATCTLA